MRKMKIPVLLLLISGCYSAIANDEVSKLAIDTIVDAMCSASVEISRRCYGINESECKELFTSLIQECKRYPSGYPVLNDKDVVEFEKCMLSKFELYLYEKGINLDESCDD